MSTAPDVAPEIALIIRKRTREGTLEPELKVRAAARQFEEVAGYKFGDHTWRRLESGQVKTVRELDLAYMAYVVGATSTELEEAGRPDVAQLLREIITKKTAEDTALAGLDPSLTPEAVQRGIQERLREIRTLAGASDQERSQMEEMFLQQIDMVLRSSSQQIQMLRAR
ncbi:hypothetical protein [Nonomuraea endophytica]|uniref:hypothetical protein n=1 Tax=Nonomuraea endophytica TaxID=714136 RepID=UPI0037C6027D